MNEQNVPLPGWPEPGDPRFAREANTLKLLAGAFAASVVVYAGIAWFLTGEAAAAGFVPPGLPEPLPWVLAGAAIALLLVAPLAEARLRSAGAGQPPERALSAFRLATVVGLAMREAAALLGLVIAVTTGRALWSFALCAAAAVAMAGAWPSRGRLERFARGAVQPS
jgi:hypothetical protein